MSRLLASLVSVDLYEVKLSNIDFCPLLRYIYVVIKIKQNESTR